MKNATLIAATSPGLRTHWNPARTFISLWRHRNLIYQLTKRDMDQRYKGSYLGVIWTLVTPLIVLAIYTFVFNVIMKARWGVGADEGPMSFALALFCGLIIYGIFSESAVTAPNLILNNSNYVTRMVFPLEILPVVAVTSALVRAVAALVILIVGIVLVTGSLSWTLVLMTLPLAAVVLLSLGVGWFLSALGVFVRDAAHTVSLVVQLLFFMTPIVYPVVVVPERFRPVIYANCFTHLVEAARDVAVWGRMPNWPWLLACMAASVAVFQLGYMVFMRSRKAFADVM